MEGGQWINIIMVPLSLTLFHGLLPPAKIVLGIGESPQSIHDVHCSGAYCTFLFYSTHINITGPNVILCSYRLLTSHKGKSLASKLYIHKTNRTMVMKCMVTKLSHQFHFLNVTF